MGSVVCCMLLPTRISRFWPPRYVRIIQQIKRQRGRANYVSYRTRWKWKLTWTSFNGQLRTVLLVTLHSWNGSTRTDPVPVSLALRDRKITLGRSMPDVVSGYAYFHGRIYTPHPSSVNGEILYERSVNQIPVGMSKLTVRLDKAGNLIAHWLLIRVHTASLYIALRLN